MANLGQVPSKCFFIKVKVERLKMLSAIVFKRMFLLLSLIQHVYGSSNTLVVSICAFRKPTDKCHYL